MPKSETITAPVDAPQGETFNPFDMGDLLKAAEAENKPAAKPDPNLANAGVEPKAAGAEKKPAHSRSRLRTAAELGVAEAEAEALSADELDVLVMERAIEARVRREAAQREDGVHRARDAAVAATPPTPPEEEKEFGGADVSEINDTIVAIMKDHAAKIKALKAEVESVSQIGRQFQRKEVLSTVERLDKLFTAVPDRFGPETIRTVRKDSKEFQRRQAVIDQMNRSEKANPALAGDVEKLFAEACDILGFAAPAATPTPANAGSAPASTPQERDEAGRWARAGLARPTDRNEKEPPKGEERAARKMDEMLFNRSGKSVGGSGVSLDDFPI